MANLAKYILSELERINAIVSEQLEHTKPLLEGAECIAAIGAGDSYAAALALEACSGGTAEALDPFDALYSGRLGRLARKGCILVALSVGGRTRAVLDVAQRYRELGGRVVAVTGPGTPLASLANDAVELVYTGLASGIGAARHVAMLAALAGLLGAQPQVANLDAPCELARADAYAGACEAYSSAHYAELKRAEVWGEAAPSHRLEQLVHAPIYTAKTVAVYESSIASRDRQREALETLREAGFQVYTVPATGDCWSTILSQAAATLYCIAVRAENEKVEEPAYRRHPGLEHLTRLIYEMS
ncbi:hypothetical protein [Hyperthermus butylicus]|uniref:Conserved Sulfolobus protein n=1 Tax=Hyperthermus butylicus (strain DSM 5456 / JCM 9403 / PLM1-5) TaxID=415426 RepID=A2BKL1_HYPBU|nr:hypothetical protein [Hyperthermus butylicus]ABM80522.1 conserved Sulfolobus protein [Hyperthermus butylicus DSM 5456]